MLDTLEAVANLINSPPGQIAAGAVLAGIVWKFFERVEALLTDRTKLEIAVWLVGVKTAGTLQYWQITFAKLFVRLYGNSHFTLRCFTASTVISLLVYLICVPLSVSLGSLELFMHGRSTVHPRITPFITIVTFMFCFSILFDYISLFKTRLLLSISAHAGSTFIRSCILLSDAVITWVFVSIVFVVLTAAILKVIMGHSITIAFHEGLWELLRRPTMPLKGQVVFGLVSYGFPDETHVKASMDVAPIVTYPAFFTSIWLWLYAGSGFLLRAARRFDVGFAWFNSKVDIERKPLSAIGLVAGAIVAVAWWTVVAVQWVVK
jgi:hypothetical protein